jgi:hypothetical protein
MSAWGLAVCSLAAGLALAAPDRAAAQAPTAAQQRFAAAYVAALQSNDPSQVTAIYHPATLACINAASQPYFDTVLGRAMQSGAEFGAHYRLTSFKAPAGPAFMDGSDLFSYPVTPTYEMQIDARGGDNMHVKIWTLIVYLAPANGGWGVVLPCPTAKGMQMIRQQLAARQK